MGGSTEMTNQLYHYEIRAYGYDDKVHEVLTHTKKFTEKEFLEILETARKKARFRININDDPFDFFTLVGVLKREYGFQKSNHMKIFLGSRLTDKLEVRDD